MAYFLTLFIKHFKMGLARLSGEFSVYFQVVVPEQHNKPNCMVQFSLLLHLFSLESSELSTGLLIPLTWNIF